MDIPVLEQISCGFPVPAADTQWFEGLVQERGK